MDGHRLSSTPPRGRARIRNEASGSRSCSRHHAASRSRSRSGRLSASTPPPHAQRAPSRERRREREAALSRDHQRAQEAERQLLREQKRLRERERSGRRSDVEHQRRSRSPSFSSKEVIKIIQSMRGGFDLRPSQNAQPSYKNVDHHNIIPNFNPSTKNQRIGMWLKKVNECALVYGWDEKTTIHFAMQKLQGLAKTWYESLNSILYTWPEWQERLTNAFPYEQNYGQCLEDMLKRKSQYNEPIETYYYEKLVLINQCDISGKRAVDCIIHGISDRTMKSSALALRCSQPEQLLQFLMSNKDSNNIFSNSVQSRGKIADEGSSSSTHNQRGNLNSTPGSLYCYNCKEKGHPFLQCTKPLVKCNKCHRIGHKTEDCMSKVTNASENEDTY